MVLPSGWMLTLPCHLMCSSGSMITQTILSGRMITFSLFFGVINWLDESIDVIIRLDHTVIVLVILYFCLNKSRTPFCAMLENRSGLTKQKNSVPNLSALFVPKNTCPSRLTRQNIGFHLKCAHQ
jgi:hypothetical protein